jgi:DNA-binding response OmpR family regulator
MGVTIMSERPRVLAVDDNEDTLELIGMSLVEGHDVLTLSNPVDIYEILDLFEPDLLVLDVMMPRITGFQLVEMLQKSPKTRELPVILLSAKDNARDIKHGYKLGASLYLTKPFAPERLLKNVKTQFEIHPPGGPKTLGLAAMYKQLQIKQSYKAGHARLHSPLLSEDRTLDREEELKARFGHRHGSGLH